MSADKVLGNAQRPVIILGAARSGTKMLRSLLAAPTGFVSTPFDSNHIWRIGNSSALNDELAPSSITDRQAATIRHGLIKVAGGADACAGNTLVEKTVSNAIRPDFVERVLPDARYIVLLRNGQDAVESTWRMWQAPPQGAALRDKLLTLPWQAMPYAAWFGANLVLGKLRGRGANIWGVRYAGIAEDMQTLTLPEICARQWRCCVETSLQFAASLPQERVVRVRYEDLVQDAAGLRPIAEFLGLSAMQQRQLTDHWNSTVRAPAQSRWNQTFDAKTRDLVSSIISPTQAVLGYY